MASANVFWHGLRHTSTVERTLSTAEHSSQFQQWSCAEFLKGRSSDQSCFCCPRLTLLSSSRVTTSTHTFMLTILRYMVHVIRRRQLFFERRCLRVWTTLHRGCAAIYSSSTPRRLRCCGVRRAVGNIRSHRKPHASATILSRLLAGYATWASTFHEDSCFQNSVQLLQCTASAPVYSAIHHASSPTVVRRVIDALSTRLRQRDPCWSTWSRVEQTPVSPECCCTTYLRGEQVQSCDTASMRSTLVAGARAYRF